MLKYSAVQQIAGSELIKYRNGNKNQKFIDGAKKDGEMQRFLLLGV
jgi:hypothetical protein